MDKAKILKKINSVKLCMMAHPDNEPFSEFEDRLCDLEDIASFVRDTMPDIRNQHKLLNSLC